MGANFASSCSGFLLALLQITTTWNGSRDDKIESRLAKELLDHQKYSPVEPTMVRKGVARSFLNRALKLCHQLVFLNLMGEVQTGKSSRIGFVSCTSKPFQEHVQWVHKPLDKYLVKTAKAGTCTPRFTQKARKQMSATFRTLSVRVSFEFQLFSEQPT
jgi:hypothetical protein